MGTCDLSSWEMDLRQEPRIRVGIMLPEDEMQQTRVTLGDEPYQLWMDDTAGPVVRDASLEVTVANRRVLVRDGAQTFGPANIIRFDPQEPQLLIRQAGAHVRGVLTGRGFHWQKRIHPTFTGLLEFRVHEGTLLLVNEVPLEHYLAGVLTAEMSGDCPLEFLKSQAIVARSWVLAFTEKKHAELPIHRCNDDDCQRYTGTLALTDTALEAIRSTRGEVLVDARRRIIDANYCKSCGGVTETPENVWRVSKTGLGAFVDAPAGSPAQRFFPVTEANLDEYLTGDWLRSSDVFCSSAVLSDDQVQRFIGKVDERGSYFRWRIRRNREDLEQILRHKYFARRDPGEVAALSTLMDLRVTRRGLSGRAIEIEVEYLDPMGIRHCLRIPDQHRIRDCLHEKFLYSSAFKVDIERDDTGVPVTIILTGAGWGHGVGMCQIGALGMALRGYTCRQILEHYYHGIRIHACY